MFKRLATSLVLAIALVIVPRIAGAAIAKTHSGSSPNCNATHCSATITVSNGEVVVIAGEHTGTTFQASNWMSNLPAGYTCPVNYNGAFVCYHAWTTGDDTTLDPTASNSNLWQWGWATYSGVDAAILDGSPEYYEPSPDSGSHNGLLPALAPSFQSDYSIGYCGQNGGGGGFTFGTPTGYSVDQSAAPGPSDYIFGLQLGANTTPQGELFFSGSKGGSGNAQTCMVMLLKTASATAGTEVDSAYQACQFQTTTWLNGVNLTNCQPQDGDLVATCINVPWDQTTNSMNITAPSLASNNFRLIGREAWIGKSSTRQYIDRCAWGYWHTGDSKTISWTNNPSNAGGQIDVALYRGTGGTGVNTPGVQLDIGQADVAAVALATNTITSDALTLASASAPLLVEYFGSSVNGLTATVTNPTGCNIFASNGNSTKFNVWCEQPFPTGGATGTFTTGSSSSAFDLANIAFTIVPLSTEPTIWPTVVSSQTCTATGTDTGACTVPSGAQGDLMLGIFELDADPQGPWTSYALTAPSGWSLFAYIDDNYFGLPGPTLPDNSSVAGIGTLQQLETTSVVITPSGSSHWTEEGWVQMPRYWKGGGGLISVNKTYNGTNDTWDRALKVNSSGQFVCESGATGNLGTGQAHATSTNKYNDGAWHLADCTYDGTSLRLYVDGALQAGPTAANSVTLPSPTGEFVLGYTKQPGFFYSAPFKEADIAVYGTDLNSTQIASHYSHSQDGTYNTVIAADSPTYWWKLDEKDTPAGNFPITMTDSAGSNNGTYYQFLGTLNQLSFAGMGDKSPWFGGTFLLDTGASILPTSSITWSATNFSWEFWIHPQNGWTIGGGILNLSTSQSGAEVGSGNNMYMVFEDVNGKIEFATRDTNSGGFTNSISTSSVNDGSSHLVDLTWDSSGPTLKVYIDGSLQTTTTGHSLRTDIVPSTLYPNIGWGGCAVGNSLPNTPCQNSGSGAYNAGALPAYLGRVAMWNGTTLSSTQVSSHWAARTGGTYDATVIADSPTSYWELNETHGTTATDAMGVNNGTYENFYGKAIAVWGKVRGASESSPTFPLGLDSINAAGGIIDFANVKNQIDDSDYFMSSGLDSETHQIGNLASGDANAEQIDLFGYNGGSPYTSWGTSASVMQAQQTTVGLGVLAQPYYLSPTQAGFIGQSGNENISAALVMPQGTPFFPGGSGAGNGLIIIGQ